MSEDSYEYDDEFGSESESEGDEFYYEDDSEEELEGGAYQLATDYIDGMGMGYGGVLMGGAAAKKKKKCISDYNLFFKKYRSAPYKKTPTQIAEMWKSGKYKVPKRVAPKGRKLCASQKKEKGYFSKSKSGSKKSVKKTPTKRKTTTTKRKERKTYVRRGTFCPENARWYKTKEGYDKYCGKAPWKKSYIGPDGHEYEDANDYEYRSCGKYGRWCPLSKRCRYSPEAILDCYNRAAIPYYIQDGLPTSKQSKNLDDPNDPKIYFFKDQYELVKNFPNRTWYTRGHLVGAKKKNLSPVVQVS